MHHFKKNRLISLDKSGLDRKNLKEITMTNITHIENNYEAKLDSVIKQLMITMEMDYGKVYKSQFQTPDDVTHFKQRLRSKLDGLKISSIRKGYEAAALASPKWCPNAMQVVSYVLEAEKADKKSEKNRLEAEHIAALPKPTITCNPIQMLRDAMKQIAVDEQNMTKAEKWEAHLKRLEAHNSLMAAHVSKTKLNATSHLCAASFCGNPGVLSNGTSGGGNFYCKKHWRSS